MVRSSRVLPSAHGSRINTGWFERHGWARFCRCVRVHRAWALSGCVRLGLSDPEERKFSRGWTPMNADVAVAEPRVEPTTHPREQTISVHPRSSAAKISLPADLPSRVRRIAWIGGCEKCPPDRPVLRVGSEPQPVASSAVAPYSLASRASTSGSVRLGRGSSID